MSIELRFWIPIVGEIPDPLSFIPDTTVYDSGFQKIRNLGRIKNCNRQEANRAINWLLPSEVQYIKENSFNMIHIKPLALFGMNDKDKHGSHQAWLLGS